MPIVEVLQLVVLGLIAVAVLWQLFGGRRRPEHDDRPRRHRAPPPRTWDHRPRLSPAEAERRRADLRQETERLALRGRIFDITEADSLPGLRLSPLGEVWITRDNPRDASGALARKAAAMFPEARVLAGLSKTRKGDRVEWRATACTAEMTDLAQSPRPHGRAGAVLVDGSNVAMWEVNAGLAGKPSLTPVSGVLARLEEEGRDALVIFDASIGHKIGGRFLSASALATRLGQRGGVEVRVVDKGQTADAELIDHAFRTGAEIVTNDLYRDHPKARFLRKRPGFSVEGQVELPPLAD